MTSMLKQWVTAATIALAAGAPASARAQEPALRDLAGSIVYIRAGNVWLYVPATGERRQVTTDGDYRSPSLADDGTVGAIQRVNGRSHFVTIGPTGKRTAFPPGEMVNVIHGDLSPDARTFAFAYVVVNPVGANPARVGVTTADHWASTGVAGGSWGSFSSSYYHARWMNDERLILSGGGAYAHLIRGARSGWEANTSPYMFTVPALREQTYDMARNGASFLVVGATYRLVEHREENTGWYAAAYRPARASEQVTVAYALDEYRACRSDSAPGTCTVGWVHAGAFPLEGEPRGGAIAPDGRAFVFADRRGVLVTATLAAESAFVVDPAGSEPEWGQWRPAR